ncbi:glycoside hydrolase family 43 protein, partial [Aureobasidium melanogenum]
MTTINPIIPGFAPDPSVTRIGDTFFLVNSTFHLFPGLPIYASRDLVNWTLIGNAINRQSQLSLRFSDTKLEPQEDGTVMLATGGLFAPTIRHDSKSGKTYVINTNVLHPENAGDKPENFIIETDDIWSDNWSDPVYFDFDGIDPSIFWDDDGKAFISGSHGPGPMTTISLFEADLSTGRKLSEEKTVWNGTGGIYPEGPHIYKKDGFYYLLISEGGTFKDHMLTIARSENIWGPYEAYENNPILTAAGTDNYVHCTGHCDMFQDNDDRWWGVCLAMRMRGSRFHMGRESFLVTGHWDQGGWPKLNTVEVTSSHRFKNDVVKATKTGLDWLYIRDANLQHHNIEGSTIRLTGSKADISQWKEPVTFVGKRQRKLDGTASVTLALPKTGSSRAGLVIYKDEHRYTRIYYASSDKSINFEVVNNAKSISRRDQEKISNDIADVRLLIEYSEDKLAFQYEEGPGVVRTVGVVDTAELSNADFVGPIIGVFAISELGNDEVVFTNFEHEK